MKIDVMVAGKEQLKYVSTINDTIDEAAKARGTGIARRTDEYIADKINNGKAIIALNRDEFVGFCYIESWGHEKFVANSGLIVKPSYRGMGVAKRIKQAAFELSRKKFPNAKIFGLTTGEQVMRINTELGYVPVTFAKLTDDEQFWAGCNLCQLRHSDAYQYDQSSDGLWSTTPKQWQKEAEQKKSKRKIVL